MLPRPIKALLVWVALPAAITALLFALELGVLAVSFYAFFALFVVARLMIFMWMRPLEIEREISDEVVNIGDHVKVVVKIRNRSPFPILWLYAEEVLPPKMPVEGTPRRLMFVPPGRTFYLHYRVTPLRRGAHQLGPLVVESGDVFGLFKKCRVDERRDFITALPPYRIVEEFQVGQRRRLGDIEAGRSIFEDPSRIRGIREYQRGDAMKRIHWKASARRGALLSKIYDPVVEAGATIVLDFNKRAWGEARLSVPTASQQARSTTTPSEVAAEIAASICRYLADGGWRVGFLSNGRDPLGLPGVTLAQARATESLGEALFAARMGRVDDRIEPVSIRASRLPEQFSVIHENLGRLELSDGLPIERALLEELPHIERSQALVVIAGGVDEGFITGMLGARSLGYRVMLFIVGNDAAHDRAFDALLPSGIEVFRMDEDWRLKEIATGRRFV